MKQNKKIAVTGGIGSGKTLFCNILKEMGCAVFSCDEIYGEIIKEEEYLSRLQVLFPECFQNGELNKERLSERIFSDTDAKKRLESLAHPLIMRRLITKMNGEAIAFAEVPLLFEGGFENLFDRVIALVRDKEERIRAVTERSGLSKREVLCRMENQFDPAFLSQKNCHVVVNDGSQEDLKQKAKQLLNKLKIEMF